MLDSGSPEKIAGFVRRYGLLRLGPDELETETRELREPARDFEAIGAELSDTIKFYTDLRMAEKGNARNTLRDSTSPLFAEVFRQYLAELENPWWTDEDYVGLGSRLLAVWLDNKVQHCGLGVVAAAAEGARPHFGQLMLTYHPPDLATAAYVELAMLVANQHELRTCEGCGIRFLPKSGRQKYHDPRCASNTRQRRWRERESGEAEVG